MLVGLGVRRWSVLVACFLAAAAAGAALRTLRTVFVAAARRGSWRQGLRAPSTGGMIVHLGVVILAVGVVSSTAYASRSEVALATGQSTVVDGQYLTFHGFRTVKRLARDRDAAAGERGPPQPHPGDHDLQRAQRPDRRHPGHRLEPRARRLRHLRRRSAATGSTSGAQIQSGLPAGSVVLGVTVEPLLSWLWVGGLVIGLGAALSFIRRRHADEVAP